MFAWLLLAGQRSAVCEGTGGLGQCAVEARGSDADGRSRYQVDDANGQGAHHGTSLRGSQDASCFSFNLTFDWAFSTETTRGHAAEQAAAEGTCRIRQGRADLCALQLCQRHSARAERAPARRTAVGDRVIAREARRDERCELARQRQQRISKLPRLGSSCMRLRVVFACFALLDTSAGK